jgi:ABC-type antimicrobial peptide transport system permease subunit
MAHVPLSYNLRGLWVRKSTTVLTLVSIGATVAVLAAVIALQQGFQRLFTDSGRAGLAVFVRPGSTNEGDSLFRPDLAELLIKSLPEVATDEHGQPIAAAEMYLAVARERVEGGIVYTPIRGVQPMSLRIHADQMHVGEGALFGFGRDEVVVGRRLVERIRDCHIGDVLVLNTTPFRVVGIIDSDGPSAGEIWGDIDRLREALKRGVYNRVIARLEPDVDFAALQARLKDDKQVPADVYTEAVFLARQTARLSQTLYFLGGALALIMGLAAVFTGTNAMQAALSARTHEIGVLLSIGFRPRAVFLSFLVESMLLGLLGGVLGCLLALPLNGIRTAAMNFDTFTDTSFAFRVSPLVLGLATLFALLLGLLGGALPASRAARLRPTEALRRG